MVTQQDETSYLPTGNQLMVTQPDETSKASFLVAGTGIAVVISALTLGAT